MYVRVVGIFLLYELLGDSMVSLTKALRIAIDEYRLDIWIVTNSTSSNTFGFASMLLDGWLDQVIYISVVPT